MAKKMKSVFVCQECGYESPKWMGKCSSCGEWNTFVEEKMDKKTKTIVGHSETSKVEKLKDLSFKEEERIKSGVDELDRVLGGGIVRGSMVLFGGDPGIGKSTLLIQIAGKMSSNGVKVLYVSGEESSKQIKLRAERLDIDGENLYIFPETNLENIKQIEQKIGPDLIVIDSIQTMNNPDIESASGSVSQVRETTAELMKISKQKDIATLIVGHVTKEGSIAGPRVLEHMVDTVLYFEGERHNTYRLLRGVKNRFGSTNEIGIFEMKDRGLVEVKNPSEILIAERSNNSEGSIVAPSVEGTRPMLVEVQALVSHTPFGMPRRVVTGLDYNRVILIIAVLEKKAGLHLESSDVYINIVGGLSIKEPAMDLGIAAAIVSSFREDHIDNNITAVGEIGLTGDIRSVSSIDKRISEAQNMGFKKIIIPKSNVKGLGQYENIKVIGVSNIVEAINLIMGG